MAAHHHHQSEQAQTSSAAAASSSSSQQRRRLLAFTGVTICHEGNLLSNQQLVFSPDTGLIQHVVSDESSSSKSPPPPPPSGQSLSALSSSSVVQSLPLLDPSWIIAPGFLELQTNGLIGIHFTTLGQEGVADRDDEERLGKVAREMATNGVTGWWATVPTVHESRWPEILRLLAPRTFPAYGGSPLLGAHVEGPYLQAAKKGAHNDAFFKTPALSHEVHQLYGEGAIGSTVKLITIAPELPGALELIRDLKTYYGSKLVISLGHSSASYETGIAALEAGATCLTHVFNAMNPLHHREPGLAGLISLPPLPTSRSASHTASNASAAGDRDHNISSDAGGRSHVDIAPYYSIIPDLIHIHPSLLRLAHAANPAKCILITDSIELAGLPDGTYPPNGQITYPQRKVGNRATNVLTAAGEKETLIGSCITLPQGVRNMVEYAGVSLAESVRCATENIADLMGEEQRGKLEGGRRADFVVLDGRGNVMQTWIAGVKVFDAQTNGDR